MGDREFYLQKSFVTIQFDMQNQIFKSDNNVNVSKVTRK